MSRPAMVMGIETEYSIYARNIGDRNYERAVQSAGCEMLKQSRGSIGAMGIMALYTRDGQRQGMQHIANGARFYLDSLHPEMSIAECQDPRQVVIWDCAGERIVQSAAMAATANLEYGVSIYKKLVDGNGNSWGCHENYCIEPWLFHRLVTEAEMVTEQKTVGTWLLVRQLLTGGGKVGIDLHSVKCAYQLSQRADFIIEFRNSQTMINRPIINTRDEALADQDKFRRLHIICGDANLCQWSTYIKMALTGLMLLLWQDRNLKTLPPLPVIDDDYPKVMKSISRDSDLVARYPVRFTEGRSHLGGKRHMTAADILVFYVETLAAYAQQRAWSSPAEADAYRQATAKAQWATGLLREGSWRSLYGWLDWPTKRIALEEYLRRKDKKWTDVLADEALMRRVKNYGDINYSALDPAESLFARLVKAGVIKTAVKSSEVVRAMLQPPPGRAAQRALITNAYPQELLVAHWNSIEFRQGEHDVQIKLQDPMGCQQDLLEHALQSSRTPVELWAHIQKNPIPGIEAYCRE